MFDARSARRLIRVAIFERDRLLDAQSKDSHDATFQQRVAEFPAAAECVPAGAVASVLAELQPRSGYSAFDKLLQAANADALNAPAAQFLLQKLEAVALAHRNLYSAAFEWWQSGCHRSPSVDWGDALERHCLALNGLIDVVKSAHAIAETQPAASTAQDSTTKNRDRRKEKNKLKLSPTERTRMQRNKFSAPRRNRGATWQEIFDAYRSKYPSDEKASAGTLRLSFERERKRTDS